MGILVNKAYKFRMYPTFSQKALINKTFGCTRLIFNKMLDKKLKDPSLTSYDMNKLIPTLKEEFPFLSEEEVAISGHGRLFYEVKLFDEIISVVKDIKRIDLKKLDGIVEWFDYLLHESQNITHISDKRIHLFCVLLSRQIKKLESLLENS